MDPTVKEKWVRALHSGQYRQGRRALRPVDDRYCCLGVLCDIYSQEHPDVKWEYRQGPWQPEPEWFFTARGDDDALSLPLVVRRWAGLDGEDVSFLTSLNDGVEPEQLPDGRVDKRYEPPLGFEKIAEFIENFL